MPFSVHILHTLCLLLMLMRERRSVRVMRAYEMSAQEVRAMILILPTPCC